MSDKHCGEDIDERVSANGELVVERELASASYKMWDVQFPTWEPNSLHWVAPSNIIIYSDGNWFLYAQSISNQRRTGGFLDTGDDRTWLVATEFLNAQGSVVHAQEYVLRSLGYKHSEDNVKSSGNDSRLAAVVAQIVAANFTRTIRV